MSSIKNIRPNHRPSQIIVHTGYEVELTDDLIEHIKSKFPDAHSPDDIEKNHITAVHHMKTVGFKKMVDQEHQKVMVDWYEARHKKSDIQAFLRKLYTHMRVSRNEKTGEIKSVKALVIAHVTIAGAHYYLNIYNNTDIKPIHVKANLNALHGG